MTAAVVVLVVGLVGAVVTGMSSAQEQEMWAPLLLSVAPLLAYMLWPVREEPTGGQVAEKKAA